jgi:hypothetical protein
MKTFRLIAGALLTTAAVMLLNSCSKDEAVTPSTNVQNTASLRQSAPRPSETSSTIVHLPGLVVDVNGNQPTNPGTVLYNPFTGITIGAINGDLITYGDYLKVNGTATVKCSNNGTQLSLHLNDLFPNATYTVWVQTFQSPGYEGNFSNRIGMGAFGRSNGSNNKFKASASGEGQFSVTLPEGTLSQMGSVGDCLVSDEFEYHIVGLYQIYGTTYGPVPGPQSEYVEHFRFVFHH